MELQNLVGKTPRQLRDETLTRWRRQEESRRRPPARRGRGRGRGQLLYSLSSVTLLKFQNHSRDIPISYQVPINRNFKVVISDHLQLRCLIILSLWSYVSAFLIVVEYILTISYANSILLSTLSLRNLRLMATAIKNQGHRRQPKCDLSHGYWNGDDLLHAAIRSRTRNLSHSSNRKSQIESGNGIIRLIKYDSCELFETRLLCLVSLFYPIYSPWD